MDAHRLYVGNLPDNVSTEALKAPFAKHGTVTNVHMAIDRQSGRSLGYAFVSMSTDAEARAAIAALDGTMFEERPLRVNDASADRDDSGQRGRSRQENRAREKEEAKACRITSQFREAQNMCYELDCRGITLSLRIFPTDRTERAWRIEASMPGGSEKVVSDDCPTRGAALEQIARSWLAQPVTLPPVEWNLVTAAMAAVRAI
jgi:RNA recognition motif-containing protein